MIKATFRNFVDITSFHKLKTIKVNEIKINSKQGKNISKGTLGQNNTIFNI